MTENKKSNAFDQLLNEMKKNPTAFAAMDIMLRIIVEQKKGKPLFRIIKELKEEHLDQALIDKIELAIGRYES